jgi:hypothetical protein
MVGDIFYPGGSNNGQHGDQMSSHDYFMLMFPA